MRPRKVQESKRTSFGVCGIITSVWLVLLAVGACTSDDAGTHAVVPAPAPAEGEADPHEAILIKDRFPSANVCGRCHPKHYREWSVSAHAYALVSPLFNSLQGAVRLLTNGTSGDFCIRCHTPVGMTLGEPLFANAMDRHPVSREGITCIVCHRVSDAYGKVHGRRGVDEGSIFQPVLGPTGDDTSAAAVGLRLQQASGRRVILQTDVFAGVRETRGATFGARVEFLLKF
ncbi:MAG: hypothetical protein CMJ83_07305 [Planctomycetes bacterium]|nr:hypothetical protein [Planctomycetota bacterium]